jgi:hypothetical protein
MQVWRALFRWSITEGLRRIDFDREDATDVAPMRRPCWRPSAMPGSAAST